MSTVRIDAAAAEWAGWRWQVREVSAVRVAAEWRQQVRREVSAVSWGKEGG